MTALTPYETLVAAASALNGTETLDDYENCALSEAESFVARNNAALDAAREALRTKCELALKYELDFFSEHCGVFLHFRNLGRGLGLELRIAESRGDFSNAARIGVDILELANAVRRGGLITDFLVSVAIAGLALERLRKIRMHLDHSTSKSLIQSLELIESDQEPFPEISLRDRKWEMAVDYPREPLDASKMELQPVAECGLSEPQQRQIFECIQTIANLPEYSRDAMHADVNKQTIALMRLLSVDLALQAYKAVHESYPDGLPSLVPRILPFLPLDPFTDKPFIYRRLAEGPFVLYSTGPGRIDHGGLFGPWIMVTAGLADLCLDARDYDAACCSIGAE